MKPFTLICPKIFCRPPLKILKSHSPLTGETTFINAYISPPKNEQDNIRTTLSTIHRILTHHRSTTSTTYTPISNNEPLLLLISMPQPLRPLLPIADSEWEDLCLSCGGGGGAGGGWEYIDSEAQGKNEYGEYVGLERLKEVLEANEWDNGGDGDTNIEESNIEEFETELGLRHGSLSAEEEFETRVDFQGMHEAILGRGGDAGDQDDPPGGDHTQVEELESMMLRMQAIKGMF